MKKIALFIFLVLVSACGPTRYPEHAYLRRNPLPRVAIVPAYNRSPQPDASMILNKAWDEAMARRGFLLINSDQVVTFAAASGISVVDLEKMNARELAKELKADLLLVSEITFWDSNYQIIDATSRVTGVSRLIDGATDALIWEKFWSVTSQSGRSGDALAQLAGALATALIHSATDQPARLANEAVRTSATTLPLPGVP